MWIDLDDEDCKDMIHQELDTKGHPTEKERIIVPAFDLHVVNSGIEMEISSNNVCI